jgi:RNA polymerase sigma factor (sigma-70 family)
VSTPEGSLGRVTGDVTAVFDAQRGRLFGLAYRLLGSASDAEDVVQDAFLRWDAADRDAIAEPAAWLTRVVTNLCLTELTSARQRRERYSGTWLPEPILTGTGPLETAAQRESVSMALLLLCEQLTAPERAVFILHEAFDYRYGDIAGIIGRSEAACRQLGHRAAARLRAESRHARFTPHDPAEASWWRQLTSQFLAAAAVGDVAGLERLLADDVVSWSDGGGKVPAGLRPVYGRAKVARLYAALGPGMATGAELTPAAARRLLPAHPGWDGLGPEVTAACLDLGVRHIRTRPTIGIDEPLYLSPRAPGREAGPAGHGNGARGQVRGDIGGRRPGPA